MPPEQAAAHCNADPECKAFVLKQREQARGLAVWQTGLHSGRMSGMLRAGIMIAGTVAQWACHRQT